MFYLTLVCASGCLSILGTVRERPLYSIRASTGVWISTILPLLLIKFSRNVNATSLVEIYNMRGTLRISRPRLS